MVQAKRVRPGLLAKRARHGKGCSKRASTRRQLKFSNSRRAVRSRQRGSFCSQQPRRPPVGLSIIRGYLQEYYGALYAYNNDPYITLITWKSLCVALCVKMHLCVKAGGADRLDDGPSNADQHPKCWAPRQDRSSCWASCRAYRTRCTFTERIGRSYRRAPAFDAARNPIRKVCTTARSRDPHGLAFHHLPPHLFSAARAP